MIGEYGIVHGEMGGPSSYGVWPILAPFLARGALTTVIPTALTAGWLGKKYFSPSEASQEVTPGAYGPESTNGNGGAGGPSPWVIALPILGVSGIIIAILATRKKK